jgi:hypothetical protein
MAPRDLGGATVDACVIQNRGFDRSRHIFFELKTSTRMCIRVLHDDAYQSPAANSFFDSV